MSDYPSDLKYSESHEWVRQNEDGTLVLGITSYAQSQLGDVVFVELPEADDEVEAGETAVTIESVKTAAEVYSPVSGTVISTNDALEDAPELVNESPFGDGWLIVVQPDGEADLSKLKDAEAYAADVAED